MVKFQSPFLGQSSKSSPSTDSLKRKAPNDPLVAGGSSLTKRPGPTRAVFYGVNADKHGDSKEGDVATYWYYENHPQHHSVIEPGVLTDICALWWRGLRLPQSVFASSSSFLKHKTWDGDGVLVVRGSRCSLKDDSGKDIGSAPFSAGELSSGDLLKVSGKDVEIDAPISAQDYLSGSCFGANKSLTGSASIQNTNRVSGPSFKPMVPRTAKMSSLGTYESKTRGPSDEPAARSSVSLAASTLPISTGHVLDIPRIKPDPDAQEQIVEEFHQNGLLACPETDSKAPKPPSIMVKDEPTDLEMAETVVDAMPNAALEKLRFKAKENPFKAPTMNSVMAGMTVLAENRKGRFDSTREGAVIMKRPNKDQQARNNPKKYDVVDVVIDPTLSEKMRPHQRDGVKFMYECVMGLRKFEGNGAILADEMGLGKTLQTIALIWTLLKQNPYADPKHPGVIGKAMVVCPVSLTTNWKKEFTKWLGRDGLGVFVGDGDRNHIKQFSNSRRHQVLVIGYEKLRTCIQDLKSCQPAIGLIVCDEGHRLKSKDAKTSKMFDALGTKRRIILSGTPLQNDLSEFWSMVDFVNPGILDTHSSFTKIYEKPIIKSRTPQCSKVDAELGQARGAKLSELSRQFILRRTNEILTQFLPPKHEYVVFVTPSKVQLDIFAKLLHPQSVQSFIRGPAQQALQLITHARKICNSPMLFKEKDSGVSDDSPASVKSARTMIPDDCVDHDVNCSGKLVAVSDLLNHIFTQSDEKVVLVSNFTQTLNILEAICTLRKYRYERLDGSVPQGRRQEMVDKFNRGTQAQSFIFLLSSKSGGAGLNLIGASRLIMFDCDWNPSTDLQAMARVHRDGQKRKVFIYRFMTAGSIEEKIFQRQVTKLGLSSSVLDGDQTSDGKSAKGASDSFTVEELRNLFSVQTSTPCQTHDLLECDCLFEKEEGTMSLQQCLDLDPDEESSDNETPYISTASNIRPGIEEKRRRKAQKEKDDKLAVLKEWNHIECLNPVSAALIEDESLRTIIQTSHGINSSRTASTALLDPPSSFQPAASTLSEDSSEVEDSNGGDDDDQPIHPPSTQRRAHQTQPWPQSDEDEEDVLFQGGHSSDAEEDEEDIPLMRKLQLTQSHPRYSQPWPDTDEEDESERESGLSKVSSTEKVKGLDEEVSTLDLVEDPESPGPNETAVKRSRRPEDGWSGVVDLVKMAREGQGGRICFLFEKVSAATL
ncbi:dna repair and recombination protein rad54b [Phaffia rhodozyma]|uniref:Dna repair and recombination protein rad54b n=1 Tax=Phaffia rhodozyma TaxID=264483 RepID=A0A0F7SEC5_PHARH|nr:dna repair and recombination protein rad54b [Phaffia rhodozyma]